MQNKLKYFVFILILWSQYATAQSYYASRYFNVTTQADTGLYSDEYQEVLTYATNNGIETPDDNVKEFQDDFMRYLVSSGIYSALRNRKFGALYVTVGDTSLTKEFAGINWIDTSKYNGTEVDTLTLIPYVGIKSDGDTAHYDIDMTFWSGDTSEFYNDFGMGSFYEAGCCAGDGVVFGAQTKGTSGVDQEMSMNQNFAVGQERFTSIIGGFGASFDNVALISLIAGSYPYLLSASRFDNDSLRAYIGDETEVGNSSFFNTNSVTPEPSRQGEFAFLGNLVTTHSANTDTANITGKEVIETITDTIQFAYIGANLRTHLTGLDSAFRVYRGNVQSLNDTINAFSEDFFYDTDQNEVLPAIPRNSARFGMVADGGSGRHKGENTTVWTVTNMNLRGAGSMNAILDSAENDGTPSTIVFNTSGCNDTTIFLSQAINQDDLTIYGQTAPSPGIRFLGQEFNFRGNNIIVQHCRFSAGTDTLDGVARDSIVTPSIGWTQYSERDALKVGGDSVVFDHCTFNFGTDELAQTRGSNVTFNYCIFSQPLAYIFHNKGRHPKGLIMFKQDSAEGRNLCLNRCVFIGCVDRNPQIGGQARILIQENYIFNSEWGIAGVYGQPKVDDTLNGGFPLMSVVKNQLAQITKSALRLETKGFDTAGLVYVDSNLLDGGLANFTVPSGYETSTQLDTLVGTNFVPQYKLKKYLTTRAGARPLDRDTVEKIAINQLERGLIVSPPQNMNFYRPLLDATPRNTTTLNIPANPNAIDSSGYKAIEVWADSLSWKLIYPDSIPWPAIEADPTGAFLWDVDSPFILPEYKHNNLTAYKEEEYLC